MSSTLPQNRTPGKLVKTATFNELLQYLRDNKPISVIGVEDQEAIRGVRLLVQIVPTGPDVGSGAQADFPDDMYWGRVLYIQGGTTTTSILKLWEDVPEADGITVPFTCLAEHGGVYIDHSVSADATKPLTYEGPHAIPIGSIVDIFPRFDANGNLRWCTFTIPRQMVMLRPTAPEAGGGKYVAYEQVPVNTDIPAAGNANIGELTTDGPTTVRLINPGEYGLSTHSLTLNTAVYAAYYIRTNKDGKRVYLLASGAGGEDNPQYQGQFRMGVADSVKGWSFAFLTGIPLV